MRIGSHTDRTNEQINAYTILEQPLASADCKRACPPSSPHLRHRLLNSRPLLTGRWGPINQCPVSPATERTRITSSGTPRLMTHDTHSSSTDTHTVTELLLQDKTHRHKTQSPTLSPMALLTRDSPVFTTKCRINQHTPTKEPLWQCLPWDCSLK